MLKETRLKFVTELSHKYNIDPNIIQVICNHPFLFAAQKIRENDSKPIRFMYLGKFKMKRKYAQENSKDKQDTE